MRELGPLILEPNPGTDRTWTRDHWESVHRYCRILAPKINEAVPWCEIENAFRDLMLYRSVSIHFPHV
jgi:hypothetical protein